MEVRQLEHFIAVVDEQQFTRAAVKCNISQSALSASIRTLERDVGTMLFVRTTKSVKLTEPGHALLDKARPVLMAMSAARDAVSDITGRLRGSLAVGGVQTDGIIDQAKLLARFHEQHPDVDIRYTSGASGDLIDAVRTDHLDLGFILVPVRRPSGVEIRELASYPMMLLCRPEHPLADRGLIDLDMLGDETFVGGPNRGVVNDAIARVHHVAGRERKLTCRVDDVRIMLGLVANGCGVALLPGVLAELRPPLVAVRLSDPALSLTVGVVTAPYDTTTRATRALLDIVTPHEAG